MRFLIFRDPTDALMQKGPERLGQKLLALVGDEYADSPEDAIQKYGASEAVMNGRYLVINPAEIDLFTIRRPTTPPTIEKVQL